MSKDNDSDDPTFMGKKPADSIEGMWADFQMARDALPEAWDDIKKGAADALLAIDRKTGLEHVTDKNVATSIGVKAGFLRGIWGGPVVAAKAMLVSGIAARLLVTSNVKDVRNWARQNSTRASLSDYSGGSEKPTEFQGPETANFRYPMAGMP